MQDLRGTPTNLQPCPQPVSSRWLALALVPGLAGLMISGYLAWLGLWTDGLPAGCGGGSGCAAVLSGRWSRWLGVPVSVPAVGAYIVALVGLGLVLLRPGDAVGLLGRWLLLSATAAIAGAAVWFITLQLAVIQAVCVWCMVDHGVGLSLAAMAWGAELHRGRPSRPNGVSAMGPCGGGVLVACLGLAVLIGGQLIWPGGGVGLGTVRGADVSGDVRAGRSVSLLGGAVSLNLDDESLLGSAEAEAVVVLIGDYACPHCRHAHELLTGLAEAGEAAVVLLPVSIHADCNPRGWSNLPSRFDESCELVRLALAVWLIDRAAFVSFDRWLFEPESPRSAEAARARAAALVGESALASALSGDRADARTGLSVEGLLTRGIEAMVASGADRVPVLLAPGREPVAGRVENPELLRRWLAGEP